VYQGSKNNLEEGIMKDNKKTSEGLSSAIGRFSGLLFSGETPKQHPVFNKIWLVSLYLLGMILWGQFLNWGNIPFDFHDWAEINAPRMAFVRDAVIKGMLPLHMPDSSALRNVTDRFMSLPDVFLSPQALFLRFMQVGPFILLNTILLYTAAFLGLLWFKRKFQLSPIVFAFLFFLFNFNGHILAHTSVGHITWGGYYLFPWFFVLIFRLIDGERRLRWSVEMALLLFLTVLQGSFHHFVWEGLFLVIFGLAAWRYWQPLLKSLVFAALFNMVRFLPPMLLLGQFDTDFLGGYPRPWQILLAMVKQVTPETSKAMMNFSSNLGYWEFDLYVGWAGILFLLAGLLLWLVQQRKIRRISPLIWPMIAIALFSIWNVYLPLTHLPIPILNGERVTSRMFILPFVLAMILSAQTLQNWISQLQHRLILVAIGLPGLVYLAVDLIRRTLQWQVTEAFRSFPTTPVNLAIKVVANHNDPPYTNLLAAGACITLLSLIAAAFLVWREKIKNAEPPKAAKQAEGK
jgi:hypothetical protein